MDATTVIAAIASFAVAILTAVVSAIATLISARAQKPPDVVALTKEIAKDEPVGIQQIAKAQLELSNNYYK